jgi:hypothetical protein
MKHKALPIDADPDQIQVSIESLTHKLAVIEIVHGIAMRCPTSQALIQVPAVGLPFHPTSHRSTHG